MEKMVVRTIDEKFNDLLQKGQVKGYIKNAKGKLVRVGDYIKLDNYGELVRFKTPEEIKNRKRSPEPDPDEAHDRYMDEMEERGHGEGRDYDFMRKERLENPREIKKSHVKGHVKRVGGKLVRVKDYMTSKQRQEAKQKVKLGGEKQTPWRSIVEIPIQHPDFTDPNEPEKTVVVTDYKASRDSDEQGDFINIDDYELAWKDTHKKITHDEWEKYINQKVPGLKYSTYADAIEDRIREHVEDTMDRPLSFLSRLQFDPSAPKVKY